MAARWAVFWPPGRILARKSVFCYKTPDFVNGPFVTLDDIFDLAPSDPFLNFSFPSYGNFREGDPPKQQKVLPHLTVGALTDSNSPSAQSALALSGSRASRAGWTNLSVNFENHQCHFNAQISFVQVFDSQVGSKRTGQALKSLKS